MAHRVIEELLHGPNGVELCLGGGAQQGICSGMILRLIDHLGLLTRITGINASSVGVYSTCYLLSRQTEPGARIYLDHTTTDRGYLDLRRIGLGRPPFRLHYMTNVHMDRHQPLAWDRVAATQIPFRAVITHVGRGGIVVDARRPKPELQRLLQAAGNMPFAASRLPVRYLDSKSGETIPAWDGSLDDPLAIIRAHDRHHGEQPMLVLPNNPFSAHSGRGRYDRLVSTLLRRHYPGLAAHHWDRYRLTGALIARLKNQVAVVSPPPDPRHPSPICRDRDALGRAGLATARAFLAALGLSTKEQAGLLGDIAAGLELEHLLPASR